MLVGVFQAGSFGRGTLAFIGGALTLLAGVILVARPGVGLAVLTLMVGAYLLVDGIFGAVLAFHVRPEKGWGWMFVSAAMGFLLGILLLKEWPLSGLWAIGTLPSPGFGCRWVVSRDGETSSSATVRRAERCQRWSDECGKTNA